MENKLKLAVFNTQPPHLYFGGVERRIMENAKVLTNAVDTTVYSGTKKVFNKTVVVDGLTVVPCNSTDRLFPLDNWTFNRSIAKKVNEIEADVYEAHAVSGYRFVKALNKRRINKPFIQTVHGVLADEYIQGKKNGSGSFRSRLANLFMGYLGRLEKEAAQQASLVVTVSRYSAKRITELYDVNQTKIRVVPNGVDIERFKPTQQKSNVKELIGESEHMVLFVGNLIPRKGLHFLIEASKQVTKESKGIKFVVVGGGPLKNRLVEYTKKLNVAESFVFLEKVDDKTLPMLYNSADMLVMPSIQEGQGISLLEAQAAGKPVVAFNVTAVPEAVKNNETGLLVNPDSTELADAVLRLLSDERLREKMGQAGRRFVTENFSWDICAKKMFQVYSEAKNEL
ncbi:MAG: glycosyltransferase family 4 protein [Candidatus Bathyarchaeia archaeon]|jgi:glycosyltransferase involved in cell wall biosynthesis